MFELMANWDRRRASGKHVRLRTTQPPERSESSDPARSMVLQESEDLDVVWTRTVQRYESTTHRALGDPQKLSFRAIELDIDASLKQGKSGDLDKAQQVMKRVMVCLQQFGSIVSTAATAVFAPSAQCWNAINFVIAAAQKYQQILDGFVALIERSAAFLDCLQVYLSDKRQDGTFLDVRLRKNVYKVLDHFLTVLANSYRLTHSKNAKLKTVLKVVLFNDDAGVNGAMAQMENLVGDLTNKTIAVILKDVEGLARVMNRNHDEIVEYFEQNTEILQQIKTGQDADRQEKNRKEVLESIRTALNIGDRNLWEETHYELKQSRTDGTGQWLISHTDFEIWSEMHHFNPVAALSGAEGFGKSHICSHVIDYLREKYSAHKLEQSSSVAYYYFRRIPGESLEKCFASLINQLAGGDESYANAVHSLVGRLGSLSALDLWKRLIHGLQNTMSVTHFMVIDGFYNSTWDGTACRTMAVLVKDIAQAGEYSPMRAFVSSRVNEIASLGVGYSRLSIPHWMLGPVKLGFFRTSVEILNQDDLDQCARTSVDNLRAEDPDVDKIMRLGQDSFAKELAMQVRGDYKALFASVQELAAIASPDDLPQILSIASASRRRSIEVAIHRLEETLSVEDINVLNMLLTWVTSEVDNTGLQTVQVLERALWIETGKQILVRKTVSAKYSPLLQITQRYPGVTSEPAVGLVSDDVRDILRTRQEITLQSKISDMALLDRVVKACCGEELYVRLDMAKLFQTGETDRDNRISLPDRNTANLRILCTCLHLLLELDTKERFTTIEDAALSSVAELLEKIDLESADRRILRKIGAHLAILLTNAPIIDSVWCRGSPGFGSFGVQRIFVDNTFFLTLERWVKHPGVRAGFAEDSPQGNCMISMLQEEPREHIFSRLSARLFKYWTMGYQTVGDDWNENFFPDEINYFEYGYRLLQEEWTIGKIINPERGVFALTECMSSIYSRFGSELDDYSWELLRAATFLQHNKRDHQAAAIAALKAAAIHQPENIFVQCGIASLCSSLQRYKDGLHHIQECDTSSCSEDVSDVHMEYRRYAGFLEAKCYRELGHADAAEEVLKGVLTRDDRNLTEPTETLANDDLETWIRSREKRLAASKLAVTELVDLWSKTCQYEKSIKLIQHWKEVDLTGNTLKIWLVSIDNQLFHTHISTAAYRLGQIREWISLYRYALNSPGLPPEPYTSLWNEFRCLSARILFQSDDDADHEKAFAILRALRSGGEIWDPLAWLAYHLREHILRNDLSRTPEETHPYVTEIENLCTNVQLEVFMHGKFADPQLTLARLRVGQGDMPAAIEALGQPFQSALEYSNTENEEEVTIRIARIASSITALENDDERAVEAWVFLQATPFYRNLTSSIVPPRKLFDTGDYPCCLNCNTRTVFVGGAYICRDCPATFLCLKCYKLLQEGSVSPLVCRKEDALLFVPELDKTAAQTKLANEILVEGVPIPLEAWFVSLRTRYKIASESADLPWIMRTRQFKAVRVIGRLRKAVLKRRAAKYEDMP